MTLFESRKAVLQRGMFKFCEFRISRPHIVISKFDDIRKKSTVPFLNHKTLKLQRVFFAGCCYGNLLCHENNTEQHVQQ